MPNAVEKIYALRLAWQNYTNTHTLTNGYVDLFVTAGEIIPMPCGMLCSARKLTHPSYERRSTISRLVGSANARTF